MILYRRGETGRYSEAGTGEILYAAIDELIRIGQREVAELLGVKMLSGLGYMPPKEVKIEEGINDIR
jgi:hypothetical protein